MKLMSKMKSVLCAIVVLCCSVGGALAQSVGQYEERDMVVTVYEDCEFRGNSRTVRAGDYANMGSLDFPNDKMSSIRVPHGVEVRLYEHDKFQGAYARVDRDIFCFDKQWNDQVSSMRVVSANQSNPGYRDKGRDDRQQDNRHRNNRYNDRGNHNSDSNVTAQNVSQVVFNNRVLQQTDPRKWQIADPEYGVSQYKEVSRDNNNVYLQNDYTAEKVRIDLFANDVTFVNRNGQRNSYPITNKRSALNGSQTSSNQPNRRIKGGCFNYKAYTDGGAGGVRFHGHDGFHRFSKKAHKGRICHNGSLTMEINKSSPSTDVIVEIQGKKFRFARKEQHDVFKNTWYRKKIQLDIGS